MRADIHYRNVALVARDRLSKTPEELTRDERHRCLFWIALGLLEQREMEDKRT